MTNQKYNDIDDATIFRSPHDEVNPYVQIRRDIFEDITISPKAKGVLGYILSRPNRWKIYHSQLQHALNIGEDYLNSALKELVSAGYARRERIRIKGKYQPYRYEISELKKFQPNGKNPSGEFTQEKTSSHTSFNQTGKTSPENPVVVNNDVVKMNYVKDNVPPYPPFDDEPEPKDETMFSKSEKKSHCFSKDKSSPEKRFKLNEDQLMNYDYLKSLKIDTSDDTLCWWARNYSLERIKDIHRDACNRRPKSIAAYMQKLFKVEACVAKAHAQVNREFAQEFKQSIGWNDLEIGSVYVTFPFGYDHQELSLNMQPVLFAQTLMQKHENSKRMYE